LQIELFPSAMTTGRTSITYACKVTGLAHADEAKQSIEALKPGDTLTLEPEWTDGKEGYVAGVYRYNTRLGAIEAAWLPGVLKPGFEYEARFLAAEYDEAGAPVLLNVELAVFRSSEGAPAPRPAAVRNAEPWQGYEDPPLYHGSPTMFRAHPVAFIISLLLTPLIIGAVILLVWCIKARTTHLQIDEHSVRYETGVFSKDRRALSLSSIRTVRVTQTLLNRLLNVGAIEIYTAGDVPEIRAASMFAPNDIRDLLGK
jgi:membrane protein YdbS with pleckstrin-like domain